MEGESDMDEERELEFEDVDLSDTESTTEDTTAYPISIDYNSRISSTTPTSVKGDDDQYYENISNVSRFQLTDQDSHGDTDCEEFNMSDEDLPTSKLVNMQRVVLDGMSCFASKYHSDAGSSYHHSSTNFKNGTECVSTDEQTNSTVRRLSFGLSVPDVSNKDGISVNRSHVTSFNFANSYCDSIMLKKRSSNALQSSDTSSSLMTCLEFLKSNLSEDDGTDVEEFSIDDSGDHAEEVADQEVPQPVSNGERDRNPVRYKGVSDFSDVHSRRKSSLTTEFLLDDTDDAEIFQSQRSRKRSSNAGDYKIDCPTDEEDIDLLDHKEWTETDESGDVRQITHIKTETSIKLEGDDAVKSLKKTPPRTPSEAERKSSTDSEHEDLSFTEKKSFFQRLSLTSETLPSTDKWTQDVSLDDLPMAEGEIIQEQISFEDKLKIFEPDEGNRKKIQKRDKQEQPTVYHYDFTKSPKDKPLATEFVVSELEKAEEIVKQVSEELVAEDELERGDVESDANSAITLDKVEQEVYSLIAEVDKEERELSKDFQSSDQAACEFGEDMEQSKSLEGSLLHDSGEFKTEDANKLLRDSYTSELEAEGEEDIERSTPAKPFEEPSNEGERSFAGESGSDFERDSGLEHKEEQSEALDEEEHIEESKIRPSKLPDITSAVDSHIKSEILQEEIDQSIEESPLEVKHIVEELEEISASGDRKCNVYKQIRTEIFSQELGEVIESGSPERKELGTFSPKKSEPSDLGDGIDSEFAEHETSEPIASTFQETSDESREQRKKMSPQISEDSCGHTDEVSSESAAVEPDEQLFDYEEAKAEHSLTEQLQALASNSLISSKTLMAESSQSIEFGSPDYLTSGMSSSLSDLEVHRRTKDTAFARHEKKEIRSLKSTKQVSTIEEHSSIESCDSPQELILHDLPEKYDPKEVSDYDNHKDLSDKFTSSDADYSSNMEVSALPTDSFRDSPHKSSPEDNDKSVPNLPLCSDNASSLPRQSDSFENQSKLSRSDSKSSHSKKSDSDAEGSKMDSVGESCGKRKEESFSSSGETESPYYSVETSDNGRTPRSTPAASRPTSSEFDINVFSGQGSEYETCVTSQEASGEGSGSYATAISSQEISYATACSSFSHSSRESAYSVDSESSGHLASIEVSSEASETLVPSAQEMELEADMEMPVLDEEPPEDDSVREPYDMDIPESIIRGGIEMPFMKNWDMNDPPEDDDKMKQLPQQWMWQCVPGPKDDESRGGPSAEQPSCSKTKSPQSGSSVPHSGPSHRRSFSSVVDIVPDRELLEQSVTSLDEEQLSVSESSATHSEQTWQTSSIDTAVQLSSQAAVSAEGPMQDSSPPDKELTPEPGQNAGSSYLQLNGPVEVDYNPDFDNPDGDSSELISNQNLVAPFEAEAEGLQFDLEIEGNNLNEEENDVDEGLGSADGVNDELDGNVAAGNGADDFPDEAAQPVILEYESQNNASALDAEKPEAQQEQSFGFRNYEQQESESRVCSDFASYLPESEQCDLLPSTVESLPPSFESEMNIPIAGSASSSEGFGNIDSRSVLVSDLASTDSLEKGETVDTSPEDERYEYKGAKSSAQPIRSEGSADTSPTSRAAEGDILNPESDYSSQHYSTKYDVPGADLYTHQEEEEFDIRDTYLSPIPSVEEDKSTPSSEAFHSKRFFPRSADTSAASSLQEFERLEAEIAAGRISRSSIGSNERVAVTKSGEHDDVSLSSLTEFEKLEKECAEKEQEAKATHEDVMMLSEIEEGLESQCSDALEILHEVTADEGSEYERRRIDIEEVIKVAQCNVEKFQEETFSEGVTSDECTVILQVASEGAADFDESEQLPLESDAGGQDSSSSGEKNCGKLDCMLSSTDSMDPSSSTATHATYQFETDSVMSSSLNSAQASGEECTMVSSTDTLEPENKITYTECGASGQEETVVHSSKGALEYKLKELQSTNGAKQQMEMFLSKLTDESVMMDDIPSYSFPEALLDDPERFSTAPDVLIESNQAAQGVSSSGDGAAFDSDDLVSTTATTTTRVVTSVITDPNDESGIDSTFVQQVSEDGIKQSCEITFSEVLNESSSSKPGESGGEE